ncbi:unnamed protein product [Symbiodinium natans]|uniref:Uncharacterized protein n=1 Tax=Symbiodinium natans TaxID=878477 RepID=A0A812JNU4_9DINO|nr:unnamed protein product [Symbiodinium natans]
MDPTAVSERGLYEKGSKQVSHIAGEAPVINAEKEFDRFMKSYEFAIEAQKLKREDITNLMELVVDRMDMYHLIGALLLEFCVGFYGEFKMLEEDYVKEPKLIMEIFLLSNIAAVGYLLFAIWLSLHASVAAHAIGVEFLLDHNRLTIPTPDNLREMRQATSLFRSIYRLFQKKLCAPQQAGTVPAAPALGVPGAQNGAASSIHADMAASSVELGDPSMLSMEALATPFEDLKMPRIKNDLIKHEHRAKFAEHHRAWLRFDAYSRVAMALGINQMLQSMSYFIAGPVQKHRPSFALITVMGVQAIAFFLLKLDWRTMDTENSDDESEKPSNKRKDVSSLEGSEFIFICITYLLPPVILVLILWIAHYFFSDPATGDLDHQGRIVSRVLSTPIFFLHAIWLYLVRQSIAPHHNDLLPVRLRTVGYLDVFTRDALQELLPEEEEEPEQVNPAKPRRALSSPKEAKALKRIALKAYVRSLSCYQLFDA